MKKTEDEFISAFAFKMARETEKTIHEYVGDLHSVNNMLQSKILNWYALTKDKSFADHFCIETTTSGKI